MRVAKLGVARLVGEEACSLHFEVAKAMLILWRSYGLEDVKTSVATNGAMAWDGSNR